jgi:GGDEF domain-containing protein
VSAKRKKPSSGTPTSPGLLHQFGQKLDQLLWRQNERSQPDADDIVTAQALPDNDPVACFLRFEEIFADDLKWPQRLLNLLVNSMELSCGFLTEILNGNTKNYHLMSQYPADVGLESLQPISSGLAGWVHTKLKPLALSSLNIDQNISYIFHSGDPLKKATSFYGWPLIYNGSLRGALLLIGSDGHTLSPEKIALLDCLALRLAAHYHQYRLLGLLGELSKLDSQTGLPHRDFFIERLSRLLADSSGSETSLWLLCISGLGHFAVGHGQAEATELTKALSQQLLRDARPEWEVGHISYGLFALAAPYSDRLAVENAILSFQKRLNDWPLSNRSENVFFIFHQVVVRFPQDGEKAEALLEAAMANLAESD